MKAKITAVIFDADNTLWTADYRLMKSMLARELRIPYSKEYSEQFDSLLQNIWSFLVNKQRFSRITESTLIEAIATYVHVVKPKVFFGAFRKCLMSSCINSSKPEALEIVNQLHQRGLSRCINSSKPEALEVVKQLHQRGYRIFVKSNSLTEVQIKRLEEFGFSPYVEQVLGCENSFVKPDPRSIAPLVNNQDPRSFIIIGDNLKTDIMLANLMFMDSIWLNEKGEKNHYHIFPTFEVSNLTQILDYLPDLRLN